jgi:hypothetical protein
MAYEIPSFDFTLLAGEDLTDSQYRFMAVDANGQAVVATAAAFGAGVLQNNPGLGEAAGIMAVGISKVEAGAAITAGSEVTSDAQGRAVTAAVGEHIHGIALIEAGGVGEIIPVLLKGGTAA